MDKTARDCTENGKIGVVAGHFRFWKEENEHGEVVFTESDQKHYLHIFSLDVPARIILQRRQMDLGKSDRVRGVVAETHLEK